MRRGQINNKSIFLIFTVALFTILSYASDQYLIRQEDKFRDINIEYNNLRTKIISYTSISQSLDDIEIEVNNTIENFLRKRHIWIKSLILISSDYKIINRKKLSAAIQNNRPVVICSWHSRLLYVARFFKNFDFSIWTVSSTHQDSEILAKILTFYMQPVFFSISVTHI